MSHTSLRGYLILGKVKDGSVGTVWRVSNSRNQVFALKQLSADNAAQGSKRREFRREAELTRRLSHRHIIKVHEYVPHRPQPFFIMEYFDSENLKWTMWHRPEVLHKREFHVLRQVAEALAYLHAQGIIHKDLKPENVLVSSKCEARLIDFSLARTKWDRLLQFGKKVEGTPLYMAPEQIRGERCDARTDIYAFGLLAYELLTKRTPFMATNDAKLFHKHLHETPESMRAHVPTLAPDLDAFVRRMLEKDPAHRPQDMARVLAELSKWEKKDTVMRLRQVAPAPRPDASAAVEVPSTA